MLTLTSPHKTFAHSLPAGAKLALLCLTTFALFRMTSLQPLAISATSLAVLALACGFQFALSLALSLRPLWLFLMVIALWHLWLADPLGGAVIALRMITAVAAATLLTMTTPLAELLSLFQRLLGPLARIGLQPKALALAIALMIRFIPVMLERFDLISQAWRARSARRIGWQVLLPTTLSALDDAANVAEALRARGGLE
jgi:biotin transport system permease protein